MSIFVKAAYAVLIFVLLLEPHIIRGHFFPNASPYVDNVVTVVVFLLGLFVYLVHRHDLQKKERENQELTKKLQEGQEKLLDSLRYLGFVNRRLPLLKNMTSDILGSFKDSERDKKRIFEQLLNTIVVSIVDADWGVLRFVHQSKRRTLKEFLFTKTDLAPTIHIGNNGLLDVWNRKNTYATENGYLLLTSSNISNPEICFLILPKIENLPEESLVVLQAIIDQAHLLYRYAYSSSRST